MTRGLVRSYHFNDALVRVITRWHSERVDLPGILEGPSAPSVRVSEEFVTEFGESFRPQHINEIIAELAEDA